MPQAGVPVSPGRTYRGDEDPDTGDGRRLSERRHDSPRPVRAVPARLASLADVTAELDFTPRPRARRTSGPVAGQARPDAARATQARPDADRTTRARPDADRTTRARPDADRTAEARPARARGAQSRPVQPRPFDHEPASQTADAAVLATGHGVAGRRTVTIHGRPADRYRPTTAQRRRPARRPHEREGFRPDRVAMWAVMLGFVLVLVAATSSHAATVTHRATTAHREVTRVHHGAAHRDAASARAVQLRAR